MCQVRGRLRSAVVALELQACTNCESGQLPVCEQLPSAPPQGG